HKFCQVKQERRFSLIFVEGLRGRARKRQAYQPDHQADCVTAKLHRSFFFHLLKAPGDASKDASLNQTAAHFIGIVEFSMPGAEKIGSIQAKLRELSGPPGQSRIQTCISRHGSVASV